MITKWFTFKLLTTPLPFVLRTSRRTTPVSNAVSPVSTVRNNNNNGRVLAIKQNVPTSLHQNNTLWRFLFAPTDELIDRKDFVEKLKQITRKTRKSVGDKSSLEIEADVIKENIIEIWKFTSSL